jgi:hypothetical protein
MTTTNGTRKVHVRTTINGQAMEFLIPPYMSLLDTLREVVGLTGTGRKQQRQVRVAEQGADVGRLALRRVPDVRLDVFGERDFEQQPVEPLDLGQLHPMPVAAGQLVHGLHLP